MVANVSMTKEYQIVWLIGWFLNLPWLMENSVNVWILLSEKGKDKKMFRFLKKLGDSLVEENV